MRNVHFIHLDPLLRFICELGNKHGALLTKKTILGPIDLLLASRLPKGNSRSETWSNSNVHFMHFSHFLEFIWGLTFNAKEDCQKRIRSV